MPRILGVDIPNDKPTHISLRYIYGIGPTTALRLCEQAHIDPQRRAKELTDDDLARLATILDREYTVEGPLRRQVQQNIARLEGHRLLPRPAPSSRSAGPRAAHAHQRPYPQGSAQDRGRQEGRQGNAGLTQAAGNHLPSPRWGEGLGVRGRFLMASQASTPIF